MKDNKLNLIIIFFIILIGFLVFANNICSPLSDIGREFYIAEQVAQGNVLYKDILIEFAPLGYLLNGFIIKIFGIYFRSWKFICIIIF